MYDEAAKCHYFFIPESSPQDPASRTRCYSIAERLALSLDVEVLRLTGDPFNFVGLGIQSLLKVLQLPAVLRALRGRAVLYVQRGQSNLPKVCFLAVLRRVAGARLVFDFDDSIFLTERRATKFLCQESDAVTVANNYLADYARRLNTSVYVIPTGIDVRSYPVFPKVEHEQCVIGWTGSPSNLAYLKALEEPLRRLQTAHHFVLRILTDARWKSRIPLGSDIPFEVVPWSLEGFSRALSDFDIGLAPLLDDPWTRGKAGYRILEYMAMQVAPVASRVGQNANIIEDGVDGYLADGPDEWVARIGQLLSDPALRAQFGLAGRRKVETRYSMDRIAQQVGQVVEATHRSAATYEPVGKV